MMYGVFLAWMSTAGAGVVSVRVTSAGSEGQFAPVPFGAEGASPIRVGGDWFWVRTESVDPVTVRVVLAKSRRRNGARDIVVQPSIRYGSRPADIEMDSSGDRVQIRVEP
jgi:hypothetical protein